jgi:hypothetical protein
MAAIEVLVENRKQDDGPDDNETCNCKLAHPRGVFVDKSGSISIGDGKTHRLRVWRR